MIQYGDIMLMRYSVATVLPSAVHEQLELVVFAVLGNSAVECWGMLCDELNATVKRI